jgi:hypothetical protein
VGLQAHRQPGIGQDQLRVVPAGLGQEANWVANVQIGHEVVKEAITPVVSESSISHKRAS